MEHINTTRMGFYLNKNKSLNMKERENILDTVDVEDVNLSLTKRS